MVESLLAIKATSSFLHSNTLRTFEIWSFFYSNKKISEMLTLHVVVGHKKHVYTNCKLVALFHSQA